MPIMFYSASKHEKEGKSNHIHSYIHSYSVNMKKFHVLTSSPRVFLMYVIEFAIGLLKEDKKFVAAPQ